MASWGSGLIDRVVIYCILYSVVDDGDGDDDDATECA